MEWQYFPRSSELPPHLEHLIEGLQSAFAAIKSSGVHMVSNAALERLRQPLTSLGYEVEDPGPPKKRVRMPVLFGPNGSVEKSFDVDAFHAETGTVIEVEAGRAVVNHQFLKDLFEAIAIQDAKYLVIAVLSEYKPKSVKKPMHDFRTVTGFMETLYAADRVQLPLKGILIIGY